MRGLVMGIGKIFTRKEDEDVEIQERMVLLEIRRSRKDGRILSKKILRFLTPREEREILHRYRQMDESL
ncbi:hypothetical protein ACP3TJ_05935 [Desulforudis sp. 1088]|uniref:hypothetical protein n=2 Tax=Candidatus Desulforudis TaxID=471826 RepID=UPI00348B272C